MYIEREVNGKKMRFQLTEKERLIAYKEEQNELFKRDVLYRLDVMIYQKLLTYEQFNKVTDQMIDNAVYMRKKLHIENDNVICGPLVEAVDSCIIRHI